MKLSFNIKSSKKNVEGLSYKRYEAFLKLLQYFFLYITKKPGKGYGIIFRLPLQQPWQVPIPDALPYRQYRQQGQESYQGDTDNGISHHRLFSSLSLLLPSLQLAPISHEHLHLHRNAESKDEHLFERYLPMNLFCRAVLLQEL